MTDQTPPALLAPARRAHVLDALARDGAVRISQLIDELGVTPVTLRRDLALMETEGLLVRVHGGAVLPEPGVRASASATVIAPPADRDDTGCLGVLVPSMSVYWPGVVRGMDEQARRRGIRLLTRAASYELQDERPILERLVAGDDVRGLIVAPNPDAAHGHDVVQWLVDSGIPTVFVERDAALPGRVPAESSTTDHALGAVLAARHLAELGHQNVGLVLSRYSPTSRKIAAGWQRACEELGLRPSQHFEELFPDHTRPDFGEAVNATLDKAIATGVTGLLVHSDPEAMAFIDIALSRGLSVPADLSIIAYDDEVAELFTPAITAVRPPRAAVGAAAVDLLLNRIADPERPVHRVTLSPSLQVRDSTAPPR